MFGYSLVKNKDIENIQSILKVKNKDIENIKSILKKLTNIERKKNKFNIREVLKSKGVLKNNKDTSYLEEAYVVTINGGNYIPYMIYIGGRDRLMVSEGDYIKSFDYLDIEKFSIKKIMEG